MPTVSVFDMAGKSVGNLELKPEVWDVPYNEGLIHQIYEGLRANLRHGTADVKNKGEVRGGGKKPWRQKGTGNARQGSRRAPHWKGGGAVFGPTPRSYNQTLPKKMRHAALKSALSQRVRDDAFKALKEVTVADKPRTKTIVEMLQAVTNDRHESTKTRSLLVVADRNELVEKSAANIPGVRVVSVTNLNLMDVVGTHRVLATQAAIQKLEETLS